ncbi:hypothetical protein F4775DRAFT_549795 [Biscogniauxia sp. FL1348]|nr:hypothetical protein F4775DRAFT_549795 [Biscogniauxia sp. FL1348]
MRETSRCGARGEEEAGTVLSLFFGLRLLPLLALLLRPLLLLLQLLLLPFIKNAGVDGERRGGGTVLPLLFGLLLLLLLPFIKNAGVESMGNRSSLLAVVVVMAVVEEPDCNHHHHHHPDLACPHMPWGSYEGVERRPSTPPSG